MHNNGYFQIFFHSTNNASIEYPVSGKRKPGASKETSPRKRRSPSKFGGMSEEEIKQLKLPDRIGFNLDILFVSGHSCPKDTSLMWTPLQYGHLSNVDTSNVDTSLMWTPLIWIPLM